MEATKKHHLYIKNMVCPRCIQSVKSEATKANLTIISIKLGELIIDKNFSEDQLNQFKFGIENNGFEIITAQKDKIVEMIKTEIINVVQYEKKIPGNKNFSDYISKEIGKDYSYLSNLFSSVEKTTIEKFIILQKIEKTKEYLIYNELTLSEISQKLGYSNSQHLSAQFKKITGMSPSQFKKLEEKPRQSIDKINGGKTK